MEMNARVNPSALAADPPFVEQCGDSEVSVPMEKVEGGEILDEEDKESSTGKRGFCADYCGRTAEIDVVGEDRRVMAWSAWLDQSASDESAVAAVVEKQPAVARPAADEAEQNRLFWEACLASECP